jgi:hypothetical protein
LRGVLILVTLILFAIVSGIAGAGANIEKPFSRWRRAVVHASRALGKFVVMLLGFWVNVRGWENYLDARRNNVVRFLHLSATVTAVRHTWTFPYHSDVNVTEF